MVDQTIKSHRDLIAWKKAIDLTVDVYRVTKAFPGDERFGLTSQIRRASSSVPANIAEGQDEDRSESLSNSCVTLVGLYLNSTAI